MATEVIFLRVQPEVKLALENQVAGMNKGRSVGEPEHTLTSFVLACIAQVCAFQDEFQDEPKKTKATKARRK